MELIIRFINGKFRTYTEVKSPDGYCFYDVDAQDRNYMESISTPMLNEDDIKRKFILVEGDAEMLNEELQNSKKINMNLPNE